MTLETSQIGPERTILDMAVQRRLAAILATDMVAPELMEAMRA